MSPLPATPPYWVTFYERDAPQKRLTARLGDTPPTPNTTGGGGAAGDWDVIALPKRSAVTVWLGRQSLISLDVPIVIGDSTSGPLEVGKSALAHMWRPPGSPTIEPPVVKIRSPGTIVPYQQLDYVVATLAWGDTISDLDGGRTMQKLTVTLAEYRADEVLQASKPKHRGRTYTVKAGDTLTSIAARFKVKGGWRAIGDAQHPPIHDPRNIHVGQRLLIP